MVQPRRHDVQCGFTLIELIVVIVLLGIVALVVLPRFNSPQTFQNLYLKDQFIAMARLAQQTALNRQGQSVSLVFAAVPEWRIDVRADTDGDGDHEQLINTATLDWQGSKPLLLSPRTLTIDSAHPLQLNYDDYGNLRQVNGQALQTNLYLQLAAQAVCISAAGYAYQPDSRARCEHD